MTGALAGPCDAGSATATGPVATSRPGLTLAATILGSSVAFIDGSVVNVALPALARDLGAGPSELTWAINAYLLPLSALLLQPSTRQRRPPPWRLHRSRLTAPLLQPSTQQRRPPP